MDQLPSVELGGQQMPAGVFLLDKPAGMSSFGVVRLVRRALGMKRVGHAGTLDPFATGLLIICAGRPATRLIDRFMGGLKTYQAVLKLGSATTTMDPEGEVVATAPLPDLIPEEVRQRVAAFVGPQLQSPPPFSAVKHQGRPLYQYARKGVVIEKAPRQITIHRLGVLDYSPELGHLSIEVVCSPGTYIRVLGQDIGQALGSCAHVCALRRTGSGNFVVSDALAAAELEGEGSRQRLLAAGFSVEEALARLAAPDTFCLARQSVLD
jgi:tRNA pseudouridine55 synthase